MGAVDIVILIGGALLALEGIAKLIKRDIRILGSTPPCGLTMLILGVGLLLKAIGL